MSKNQKSDPPQLIGRIYRLWHIDDESTFYIGSTKTTIQKRLNDHKRYAKSGENSKLYQYMRQKGVDGVRIIQIEEILFKKRSELAAVEQRCISELKPQLNSISAVFDKQKQKENQAAAVKRYTEKKKLMKLECDDEKTIKRREDKYEEQKKRRLANKDKHKCIVCNYNASDSYSRHLRTKKHQDVQAAHDLFLKPIDEIYHLN